MLACPVYSGTVSFEQTRVLCLLIMWPEARSGRLPTMHLTTRDELVDGQCSSVVLERCYYPVSLMLMAVLAVIFMACGVTR
jgi:hypothetical protein